MSSPDPVPSPDPEDDITFRDVLPLILMYIHMLLGLFLPIWAGAHASLSRPLSAAAPPERPKRDPDSASAEDEESDDEEEEEVQEMVGWTASDAIVLPVTAAIFLFGVHFMMARFGASLVSKIFGTYYAFVGVFAAGKVVEDGVRLVERTILPDQYWDKGRVWEVRVGERRVVGIEWKKTKRGQETGGYKDADGGEMVRTSPLGGFLGRLPLPGFLKRGLWALREKLRQKYVVKGYLQEVMDFRKNFTRLSVVGVLGGLATIPLGMAFPHSWWFNNLIMSAVTYMALQAASTTSFRIGSLVMIALLVYDVVMVFFTPVMEKVALNLAAPVMMEFPGPLQPSETPGAEPQRASSRVGGGDVILPGMIMAMALRFDLYMFYLKKQKTTSTTSEGPDGPIEEKTIEKAPYISISRRWGDRIWTMGAARSALPDVLSGFFPRTYFIASIVGYVAGLIVTFVVVSHWRRGQPALLYLVPGILISLWLTALVRGEVKHMWNYTESITAEQLEEAAPDAVKDQKEEMSENNAQSQAWTSRLWHSIFGEAARKSIKDKEKNAGLDKTESSKETETTEKPTEPSKSLENPDLVFSFSIKRRNPPKSQPSTVAPGRANDGNGASQT